MFYCKIIKIHLLVTICSLAQAAYISRMATVNRMRAPFAFRPGITIQRPWHKIVPAASNRIPFVVYRNPPHRYVMKHIVPHANLNLLPVPWKKPRLPQVVQVSQPSNGQAFEFVRGAASSAIHTDGGTDAIHTIPAPNLSLAEKPIVVIDAAPDSSDIARPPNEAPKPIYEVTEKVPEVYQMAKVEAPTGFSKSNSLTSQELESLIKSASAFQLTPEYNLPIINIPEQYIPAGFKAIQANQEYIPTATEPVVIPHQAIIQPDPDYFQTVHSQLHNLHKLSPIEFIPFIPDVPTSNPVENSQQITQNQLLLLTNEEVKTQEVAPGDAKTIVQRETQESSLLSLIPQPFETTTETIISSTDAKNNITETISTEHQAAATTTKYVIENITETLPLNVTPIYYAQVGQNIGNVIANSFYSALNDVRAAAALAQVEKPQESRNEKLKFATNSTTTINPDSQNYFAQNKDKLQNNSGNEIKHLLGTPFAKTADSVKVAYTLVRAEENDPKVSQEGTVYAGQIVEASISEDADFNKEKVNLIQRRAPIRLVAVSEQNDIIPAATNIALPKVNVVKAKIPPKSKLLFDDKTGEPILRIYASYSDNPTQKEIITSKLSSLKRSNGGIKKEFYEAWNPEDAKALDNTNLPSNEATQFGLKIKDRSDDYIPLFEDYEE
ncbi:hypothetical protein K1T71_005769 [Dendrolimus kikuchii]|uniref:Uncharacterized protein n=1 Tax=Dendrolimus kikuchii TaxID=765133 RepID=A0ACC1D4Z1_9NEOP|nr:hypothetical protein K1T71_005769 [Dendrolimus kikuchii]